MQQQNSLPDVIIVYGPPLAGKGTQSDFLQKLLPDYFHLDFGTQLREFVKLNTISSNQEFALVAGRLKEKMDKGEAVLTEDLRFVVETTITQTINNNQKLLVEGPGRLIEEAEWISKFVGDKKLNVVIFHLHIGLEETLRRAQKRWYVEGINLPFVGYDAAKSACSGTQKPYQRIEDTDPSINMKRYETLYNQQYATIIQTFQYFAHARLFTIDGHNTQVDVSNLLAHYLSEFYYLEK
jgi:adenylate kinase family enzyme